jgi:hypothetical protein
MPDIRYPAFARDRGLGYWLRPGNIIAARRKFLRLDYSIEWRRSFPRDSIPDKYRDVNGPNSYSTPISFLAVSSQMIPDKYRFLILGDTGEGDRSQYGTIPLIRSLKPDFMIINGDIAYPAGRIGSDRDSDDYIAGFFEPYKNLGIPIWGVPGNHEYYPKQKGREFFDTYCTYKYLSRWEKYGLRLVPQPGPFWELREPRRNNDLTIIGVDTGLNADLDGHHSWWQIWKRKSQPDYQQLAWLQERLDLAERRKNSVIIMFHIPALVNQAHEKNINSSKLHQIIANYECVKLVISAHIHNFQKYSPDIFARYLIEKHKCLISRSACPHYLLSGGGGAYLTSTDFKKQEYSCESAFPTRESWRKYAGFWQKAVHKSGLAKSPFGRIVAACEKGTEFDADVARFLSMLLVEVERKNDRTMVKVIPVFLDDLKDLFSHLDQEDSVYVCDENPRINQNALNKCLRSDLSIEF